ncbi:hypothetical protein MHU86_15479 [Fragilaria crotonensis]|nr:hypothetical protein MHU86_15479 [Fragilaria crotonensis]
MDIIGTDPFAGRVDINGTVLRWVETTGKGGITLDVFNALDDTWQRFFAQAISDWNSGTPDALNLSTTQTTPESSCDQVDGVMKVCNGNSGDTGWRGINELILTSANTIVSSVVKVNEFFLTNYTSDLDKQYAMCHEIGHGFGLAHTDENFLNSPLGDCLDYSNSVRLNQKPGQINFEKLVTAYGEIGSRRQRRDRQISCFSKASRSRIVLIPELAKKTFREKVPAFQVGIENEGWTLLHQHKCGEIHKY